MAMETMPMMQSGLMRRRGLSQSMMGNGAFSPSIPGDPSFDTLGQRERFGFSNLGESQFGDINQYASGYENTLAKRRSALADSLLGIGQQQFAKATPGLLEDLNSRGLFTSQTARDKAFADTLGDITRDNQRQLLDFDTAGYGRLDQLRDDALAARLGGQSRGLESEFELQRSKLQGNLDANAAAQEQALAEQLAKEQRRSGITQSLIGAGGQLLGAKMLGGSLLGGGAGAGGAGAGGAGGGFGLGGMLAPAAGLLGGGYLGQSLSKLTGKNTRESKAGSAIGAGLGTVLGGPLGGLAGGAIGGLGTKAVQGVAKSVKKIFCFDFDTPITMADGSSKKIFDISLGDMTKGGAVESIRKSFTDDGTRYNYKGVYTTAYHAVLEDGIWKRVKDSTHSIPVDEGGVVYSLVTSDHRIYVNGIVFSDEHESDDYENLTIDESLEKLNKEMVGA